MKNLQFLGHKSYCVSVSGGVYSLKTGRFLKPFSDTQGYQYVELYTNKTKHRFAVHRLVALAFMEKPLDIYTEVNHIDGDKTHNDLKNLEWVTPSENCVHAERTNLRNNATLDDEDVRNICRQLENGLRVSDICRMFGVEKSKVSDIKNLNTYKYISSEFDFSKLRRTERLSDEKVIKICIMLQDKKGYKDIAKELNVKTYIIGRIKRRIHFNEISKNFNW